MLLGPGPESAPRSAFWAILGTCLGVPQRVLCECFLAFLGPKKAKKHSKSTLWGTPRQVPKIAQKALRGALSGPGPKSTPVNGGRDRNHSGLLGGVFACVFEERDASMRAPSSDRQNCSHNVSQTVKRIRRVSELWLFLQKGGCLLPNQHSATRWAS